VNLVIGVILGLLLEPVKERLRELSQQRRANREIYDDLGAYLARFVGFMLREKARVKHSAERFDIMFWQDVTLPYLPHFDHYFGREPGVFLRTDNSQGIRNLVQRLRMSGDTYRSPDAVPFAHPDTAVFLAFYADVFAGYSQFANSKESSRRRTIRAFNRHREDDTTPFPFPAKRSAASIL
jgi:hypothetical protein